jgi:hypothetical protein
MTHLPDLRGKNWADIWPYVRADRLAAYDFMLRLGAPGATGSELAAKMGRSVLSVRPRLTELRQMHLLETTGERRAGEHVLRAVDRAEAERRWTMAALAARQGEAEPAPHARPRIAIDPRLLALAEGEDGPARSAGHQMAFL